MRNRWILGIVLFLSGQGQASEALTQAQLDAIGHQLSVSYQVVDNASQVDCDTPLNDGRCFTARLSYENGDVAIPAQAKLYFSHISPIVSIDVPNVRVRHLKGDLHVLQFVEGLAANARIDMTLLAPFWHAARSDVMPNHYITLQGLQPVIIHSTRRISDPFTRLSFAQHAGTWQQDAQFRRHGDDKLALETPELLYSLYPDHWPNQQYRGVLPAVAKRSDTGERVKTSQVAMHKDDIANYTPAAAALHEAGLVIAEQGVPLKIQIQPNRFTNDEAYQLNIAPEAINIEAASPIAAQYAALTLAQLYDPQSRSLPVTRISDSPRFGFRGVHLDVARHFPGKRAIQVVLEQMFLLKLNVLHLHLSDDEGWRVEIPELPELTEIGAYRCHDLTETRCLLPQLGSGPHKSAQGNGYLTVDAYQQLLKQAQAMGIEIVPSFDMPGHARAAIRAMDARYQRLSKAGQLEAAKQYLLSDPEDTSRFLSVQYYDDNAINPCLDSSYRFVETILSSLKRIHDDAGVPLSTYHLGADETAGAWTASPQCLSKGMDPDHLRAYFVSRVVKMGNQLGLTMAGWSDGMDDSLDRLKTHKVQVNIWDTLFFEGTAKVNAFAAAKIPTVLSLPDVLYFDFPYRNHPHEPGYYWGSKSTSMRKVFEFMPARLEAHQHIWKDRMGNAYTDHAMHTDSSQLLGIQAQLWTEVTPNQAHMEYMLFPRLLAFAERAWHLADWQSADISAPQYKALKAADWQRFMLVAGNQWLIDMAERQLNLRIPPPGAKWSQGTLYMRSPMPGLDLQYSLDGNQWRTYTQPVSLSQPPLVRSKLSGGDRFSAISQL